MSYNIEIEVGNDLIVYVGDFILLGFTNIKRLNK